MGGMLSGIPSFLLFACQNTPRLAAGMNGNRRTINPADGGVNLIPRSLLRGGSFYIGYPSSYGAMAG